MNANFNREERIDAVSASTLNGVRYVEVLYNEKKNPVIVVYCISTINDPIDFKVKFEGGVRVKNITSLDIILLQKATHDEDFNYKINGNDYPIDVNNGIDKIFIVTPSTIGDYSPYTLKITGSKVDEPPEAFDDLLSDIIFSFHSQCPTDQDCLKKDEQVSEPPDEPIIDYLARDYQSFTQLMLNQLQNAELLQENVI